MKQDKILEQINKVLMDTMWASNQKKNKNYKYDYRDVL